MFPISRDPPEGGTYRIASASSSAMPRSFQFLGIPPKGELLPTQMLNRAELLFPISRDPPEGGTSVPWALARLRTRLERFQFLGIPPKGEPAVVVREGVDLFMFPISRDPPEGGTTLNAQRSAERYKFPISRDPPEGGTHFWVSLRTEMNVFPISRDPPEGGTRVSSR